MGFCSAAVLCSLLEDAKIAIEAAHHSDFVPNHVRNAGQHEPALGIKLH
jgi:hypothetical protein